MAPFDNAKYTSEVLNPAQSEFERSGVLPDAFARYGLELSISNTAEIETRVTEVVAFWNKFKGNAKYAGMIAKLLSESTNVRRALLDEVQRGNLAADVSVTRAKLLAARFEALDQALSLVVGKGFITAAEKAALVTRFVKSGLAEADIVGRIRVPTKEAKARVPDQGLDDLTRRRIKNNLGTLGLPNLYAFLGTDERASREELARRHAALTLEWDKKHSDFKKTAAQGLLADVKNSLINGDPAKYQLAVMFEAYQTLKVEVDLAATGKVISKETFRDLVERGIKLGLDDPTSREYVLALALDAGAAVEAASTADSVRCGACLSFQPKGSGDHCTLCGAAIWLDCPKCKKKVSASDRACAGCGFVVANLHRVKYLLRNAEIALADGDVGEAQRSLQEAEKLWGPGPELAAIASKVREKVASADGLRRDLEEALASGKLAVARQALLRLGAAAKEFKGSDGKTLAALQDDLDLRIRRSEAAVAKGREAEHRGQKGVAACAYQEALQSASDSKEALEGLRRLPPEPARNLRAQDINGTIVLQWDKSPAAGNVSYVVVRQIGRPPTSWSDGDQVARTEGASCNDPGVDAGALIAYGVFVDRSGVASDGVLSPLVRVLREVAKGELAVDDGSVQGTWSPTPNNAQVRVFRSEGSAPGAGRGEAEIALSSRTSFVDHGVRNGVLYHYRISVEYQRPDGSVARTPGLTFSVRPEAPPQAVAGLDLRMGGGSIEVAWPPQARGSVSIYRRANKPAYQPGHRLGKAELQGLGTALPGRGACSAVDVAPPTSVAYYVAVTEIGDVAIAGATRRFVPIADPTDVAAEDFGRYVQLTWVWPRGANLAIVSYRQDKPPEGPEDPVAIRCQFPKSAYDAQGGFRLETPADSPHYFVVYCAAVVDGEHVFSSGLGPSCSAAVRLERPATISYRLNKAFWGGKISLELQSDSDLPRSPVLILVARSGDLQPRRAEDGVEVTRLSSLALQKQKAVVIECPPLKAKLPAYFRLFLAEAGSGGRVTLVHPLPKEAIVK